MGERIPINAFDMSCIMHQSPGLWARPEDQSVRYKDLRYWTDLAQLLERGKFDSLFIADVLGIYDTYQGSGDASIRRAVQIPVHDPVAKWAVARVATASAAKNMLDKILASAPPSKSGEFRLTADPSLWSSSQIIATTGALSANAFNNLPAYLALEPVADSSPTRLFALLLGVNCGPLLTLWASLATLLWRERCQAANVDVSTRRFFLRGLVVVPLLMVTTTAALSLTS